MLKFYNKSEKLLILTHAGCVVDVSLRLARDIKKY